MERESFEDEEVASLLNQHYISIKVDREERPDIDHIYMAVCQAMTGHGGWPMTIIMTPKKQPFFAGTYFPKASKWGRPGLMDILHQVAELWEKEPQRIAHTVERITEAVTVHLSGDADGELTEDILAHAFQLFRQQFDHRYGGFGDAPKFPTPHNLLFLLRHWKLTGEEQALAMVEQTLAAMHRGGIYDHVGFGFSRYSVDREWLVPHFEKMLYDNALLAYTYLEAYQATKKPPYAQVAKEIFTYVLRDMTDPEGGFYSAEDADSEGEEGKFYLWTPDEIRRVLGSEAGELYCTAYDITETGNFEGRSIPNLIRRSLAQTASQLGKGEPELRQLLADARERLFAAREQRVHPGKDDKILTAWNGLMIAALAKAAQVLGEDRYEQAAARALQFVQGKISRQDGRLLARYRDGEAAHLGYADDYAFLVWGLLELYEATLDSRHLREAVRLTDDLLRLFWDEQAGGLFFYGSDGETLIARPKEIYDGATPSGNSVAAHNLLRLFHLTGRPEYQERAERLLQAFAGSIEQYPPGYSFSLMALQLATGPAREIVIAGERGSEEVKQLRAVLRDSYQPLAVIACHDPNDTLADIAPAIQEKTMQDGKATVYVCENFTCSAPLTDVEQVKQLFAD
jgi:hypothetical protein